MTTTSATTRPAFKLGTVKPQSISKSSELAAEVRTGLSKPIKTLPSKLFYDEVGSALFNRIMRMPEYYPSRCEREILAGHAVDIVGQMPKVPFLLVDLGSGDGTKTRLLIDELVAQGRSFTYVPVDISHAAIEDQIATLKQELPGVQVEGVIGEFFTALEELRWRFKDLPWFTLFLGGNIGNFDPRQAAEFLSNVQQSLHPGDLFFCGFDLQKAPSVIKLAYDDPTGITAAFNYNLLERLNRELGADFNLDRFVHYATYEPLHGVARSFLLSTEEQTVHIDALDMEVSFRAWEAIHTENSYKYTLEGLAALAHDTGFEVEMTYLDDRRYFTDAIWLRR